MTPPLPDEAARRRAIEDHAGPLAVEAGAGTGKTTLLVARILAGLVSGKLTIDRLAAITFTRRAAAELRARLRRAVGDRLQTAADEERERLLAAQRGLPLARISTVHSFCAHFLREHALAAGLDPDFGARDEEDDSLFDELWEEWLDETLADDLRAAPIREVVAWGGRVEALQAAARLLFDNPDCAARPAGGGRDDEALWRAFVDRLARAREELGTLLKPDADDPLFTALDDICRECDRLSSLPTDVRVRWLTGRIDKDALRLPGIGRNVGRQGNYQDRGAMKFARERLAAWREREIVARIRTNFAPLADAALAALGEFRDWALQARKDRRRLDFVDQLFELAGLLKDDRVHSQVRSSIDELLVDEFQDTDPLMARIFDEIAGGDATPVFVVGDPKQSIYRFRRADVATYSRCVEGRRSAGRAETITVNFRAARPLLERVDRLMQELFTGGPGSGEQARWESLVASPEAPATRGPAIVLAPVGDAQHKLLAGEVAELEANALAEQLRLAHDDGFKWREMAVLFPRTGRTELLEAALDRAGVRYRQEKSKRFFLRAEIAEVAAALSAVADPHEPLFTVATLRSRLFGFPDAQLARHRASGGVFAPQDRSGAGDPEVAAALARMAEWRRCARRLSPPDLLETILVETRFREVLAAGAGGARALANIQRLGERVRAHWDAGGADLGEVAEWLRVRVAAEDVRAAESPAAEEEDRVALLTIHGAKGLEWSVVGLFDLRAGPPSNAARAVIDRRDPDHPLVAARFGAAVHSSGFGVAQERDGLLEEAEKVRLLYVAATRARQRLVIPIPFSAQKVREGSLLALLETAPTWREWRDAAQQGRDPEPDLVVVRTTAGPPGEIEVIGAPPPPEPQSAPEMRAARARWQKERRALLAAADRFIVTRPSALHGAARPAPPPERPRAREIGSAVHRALEWLASGAVPLERAREAAGRAAFHEDLACEDARFVAVFVERAAASDLLRRALAASFRSTETPFSWTTTMAALPDAARTLLAAQLANAERTAAADQSVMVEGIADLVFRENDGLVVVDYKTDPWGAPEDLDLLAADYRPQVEVYGAALAAATGLPVREMWLLFLGGPETTARRL